MGLFACRSFFHYRLLIYFAMKKYLFYLMLFSCSGLRAETARDLAKYSYFCFAIDKNKSFTGTCFLYKYDNDIYLVSNYHVFYGTDIMANKQLLHVDTLRVSYISNETKQQRFYKIDNDKDDIRFFKHYDSPDLMAKKLDDFPADMPLNLINDLMETSYFKEEPDSVIIFGYPSFYAMVKNASETKAQECFLTASFQGVPVKFHNANLQEKKEDGKDRRVQRKIDNTEFEINTYCLPGFSGSPVYGKFHKNGTVYYRFIGVVFASNLINNFSLVIKGKVFYDFIKNMSVPKMIVQIE